jgi:hypothetical protein
MTKDELTLLRANILGGINEYIRETMESDEQWIFWVTYGLPDECDEETLMEIAEDGKDFYKLLRIASSALDWDFDED